MPPYKSIHEEYIILYKILCHQQGTRKYNKCEILRPRHKHLTPDVVIIKFLNKSGSIPEELCNFFL